MGRSFLHRNKGKLFATLMAAAMLFPAATASAWGGYGPGGWGCDPQWAYLEEYGFLDPYGPSATDFRRLNRDQWRAVTRSGYYGSQRHDPVAKAVRRQCRGSAYRSHYW